MTTQPGKSAGQSYLCPVCDTKLAAETAVPTHGRSCAKCGYLLWSRKKMVNDVAVLDIVPGCIPEPTDIKRLAESLVSSQRAPHAVLDLSRLESVSSSFLARLLLLRKQVQRHDGRLILCELRGLVRDTLASTRLDTILEVADDQRSALARLQRFPVAWEAL